MLATNSLNIAPSGRFHQLILVALCFVTALFGFTWLTAQNQHLIFSTWTVPGLLATIGQDGHVLSDLRLTHEFEYKRNCIIAVADDELDRTSRQVVDASFVATDPAIKAYTLTSNGIHHDATTLPECDSARSLQVPSSDPQRDTQALSTVHIVFGVVTSVDRLATSLPEMSHWLAHTGARLVVIVPQADPTRKVPEVPALLQQAAALGIDIQISTSSLSTEQANLQLASVMQRHARETTKWYAIMDDDTFFVDIDAILDALAQFDAEKPMYVGQLTDDQETVNIEGLKAWGGAGIFLSQPLVSDLATHVQECLTHPDLSRVMFGDVLIRDCIQLVTSPTVQLTPLPGLYQLDNFGSMDGWYESGRTDLITIHHWKSWHHAPVPEAHTVTRVAGYKSFLQRYVFADNVVLTNGYSIVQYPGGLPDLEHMEHTMDNRVDGRPGWESARDRDNVRFIHGRTRRPLGPNEKISWKHEKTVEAILHGRRCVRQFYVRRADPADQRATDSVHEVDWCAS